MYLAPRFWNILVTGTLFLLMFFDPVSLPPLIPSSATMVATIAAVTIKCCWNPQKIEFNNIVSQTKNSYHNPTSEKRIWLQIRELKLNCNTSASISFHGRIGNLLSFLFSLINFLFFLIVFLCVIHKLYGPFQLFSLSFMLLIVVFLFLFLSFSC